MEQRDHGDVRLNLGEHGVDIDYSDLRDMIGSFQEPTESPAPCSTNMGITAADLTPALC
jgi:hypothetical protein